MERRGDALERSPRRRRPRLVRRRKLSARGVERPYATLTVILGSAILLLVQR